MADFVESLSSVLATSAALPSSSATWSGPTFATLDGDVSSNVTMSNGNLTATSGGTVNTGARSASTQTTGKYYFEITRVSTTGGGDAVQGLITTAGTFANLVTNGTNCTVVMGSSMIYSNNASSLKSIGGITAGDIVCCAIDLTARKAWFRRNNGNWNGLAIGLEDPANNIGGVTMEASVAFAPAVGFSSFTSGQVQTVNLGASVFTYAVPSGFTSGWPFSQNKQSLQATFTPQRAGRVRALVRLGKTSTTAWIDPRITIA
jgi:hypothetical protein